MPDDIDPVQVGKLIGQMEMLIPAVEASVRNQDALGKKIDANHKANQKELKEVKQCMTDACNNRTEQVWDGIGKTRDEMQTLAKKQIEHGAKFSSHLQEHARNPENNVVRGDGILTKPQKYILGSALVTIAVAIAGWIQSKGGT